MSSVVVVSGSFDDFSSHHLRLLHEASRHGAVHALLWSDEAVAAVTGAAPKYPLRERQYLLQAVRFVEDIFVDDIAVSPADVDPDSLPDPFLRSRRPTAWIVDEAAHSEGRRTFCVEHGLQYRVLGPRDLDGFPVLDAAGRPGTAEDCRTALVTGCFDWFH